MHNTYSYAFILNLLKTRETVLQIFNVIILIYVLNYDRETGLCDQNQINKLIY